MCDTCHVGLRVGEVLGGEVPGEKLSQQCLPSAYRAPRRKVLCENNEPKHKVLTSFLLSRALSGMPCLRFRLAHCYVCTAKSSMSEKLQKTKCADRTELSRLNMLTCSDRKINLPKTKCQPIFEMGRHSAILDSGDMGRPQFLSHVQGLIA